MLRSRPRKASRPSARLVWSVAHFVTLLFISNCCLSRTSHMLKSARRSGIRIFWRPSCVCCAATVALASKRDIRHWAGDACRRSYHGIIRNARHPSHSHAGTPLRRWRCSPVQSIPDIRRGMVRGTKRACVQHFLGRNGLFWCRCAFPNGMGSP